MALTLMKVPRQTRPSAISPVVPLERVRPSKGLVVNSCRGRVCGVCGAGKGAGRQNCHISRLAAPDGAVHQRVGTDGAPKQLQQLARAWLVKKRKRAMPMTLAGVSCGSKPPRWCPGWWCGS